jgi:hypothetical protein
MISEMPAKAEHVSEKKHRTGLFKLRLNPIVALYRE